MKKHETKTLCLDCGIAPRRLISWLGEELALSRNEQGAYLYASEKQFCTVLATPQQPSVISGLQIERTSLVIDGAPAAVDAFVRAFTLRFISAGG